jgi:hypothetical protein
MRPVQCAPRGSSYAISHESQSCVLSAGSSTLCCVLRVGSTLCLRIGAFLSVCKRVGLSRDPQGHISIVFVSVWLRCKVLFRSACRVHRRGDAESADGRWPAASPLSSRWGVIALWWGAPGAGCVCFLISVYWHPAILYTPPPAVGVAPGYNCIHSS